MSIQSNSVNSANQGLGRYYAIQGVNDYNNKFLEWCDDQDLDSEAINEEFSENPNESILLEFDEDFPLPKTNNDDEKNQKIIEIIKECFTNPQAYSDIDEMKIQLPSFTTNKIFNISKQEITKCIKLYKKQCPVIFNSGMQDDTAFITTLAIGGIDFEYLQCIISDYFREAVKHNSEQKKTLTISEYVKKSKHFIKLNNIRNTDKGEIPSEIVQSAIKSFSNRICPKLMFQPLRTIQDSLESTATYIAFAVQWVSKLANTEQINQCPFQFDLCFAYPSTKKIENKIDFEDDDDDDDDDTNDKKSGEFFDCIGDIKDKVSSNKLKHVGPTPIDDKQAKRNRIFGDTFHELAKEVGVKDYPFRKRFVSFIDRRDSYDDDKDDTIIMYEPPDNARNIPNPAVPEWYLSSSRTCLLPNANYNKNESESGKQVDTTSGATRKQLLTANITCQSSCNGALLTFSFHAKAGDNIKCYMYINGQITRFLPNDIVDVLPLFFDMGWNDGINKLFVEKEKKSEELLKLMEGKLIDKTFKKFQKTQ